LLSGEPASRARGCGGRACLRRSGTSSINDPIGDFSRSDNNPFDTWPLFYEEAAPILTSAVAQHVIRSTADHQLLELVFIMKSLIKAVVVVASIAASATVFAQSNTRITREQVRAELVQLEQAGYRVGDGDQTHYPEAVQAAQARIAARNSSASAYGGSVAGSSQSGRPAVSAADWNAMYSR
jgi:hypothetical protein